MVNPVVWQRFVFRSLFALTCFALIFIKMLPLSTAPSILPGPDLIYCLTAAFLMRRPRFAPVLLVVAIFVISDLLFLKPLGLWPAIALLAFEYLREQSYGDGEMPLGTEIVMVSLVFIGMIGANAAVYVLFGIPHPGWLSSLLHIVMTVICYPFVILATELILRVRRPRPGEIEADGTAL